MYDKKSAFVLISVLPYVALFSSAYKVLSLSLVSGDLTKMCLAVCSPIPPSFLESVELLGDVNWHFSSESSSLERDSATISSSSCAGLLPRRSGRSRRCVIARLCSGLVSDGVCTSPSSSQATPPPPAPTVSDPWGTPPAYFSCQTLRFSLPGVGPGATYMHTHTPFPTHFVPVQSSQAPGKPALLLRLASKQNCPGSSELKVVLPHSCLCGPR